MMFAKSAYSLISCFLH